MVAFSHQERKVEKMSKKLLLCMLAVLIAVPAVQGNMIQWKVLDRHMTQITSRLGTAKIQSGANKIAVLPLAGDTASDDVRAKVEAAVLGTGKFELVDRANIPTLMEEIDYQEGAEIDGKTAKELKIKGVDYLVVGNVAVSGADDPTQPYIIQMNLKVVNCSTAGTIFAYNRAEMLSVSDRVDTRLVGLGPKVIIVVGLILLVVLVLVFKLFRGAKSVASNTIFAAVKDYLVSDKKVREHTGAELRSIKAKLKDAVGAAEKGNQSDFATSIGKLAGDVDLLAQAVTGAPFGQDMAQSRAIPRDVAERLKAAGVLSGRCAF